MSKVVIGYGTVNAEAFRNEFGVSKQLVSDYLACAEDEFHAWVSKVNGITFSVLSNNEDNLDIVEEMMDVLKKDVDMEIEYSDAEDGHNSVLHVIGLSSHQNEADRRLIITYYRPDQVTFVDEDTVLEAMETA